MSRPGRLQPSVLPFSGSYFYVLPKRSNTRASFAPASYSRPSPHLSPESLRTCHGGRARVHAVPRRRSVRQRRAFAHAGGRGAYGGAVKQPRLRRLPDARAGEHGTQRGRACGTLCVAATHMPCASVPVRACPSSILPTGRARARAGQPCAPGGCRERVGCTLTQANSRVPPGSPRRLWTPRTPSAQASTPASRRRA